MNHYLGAWIAPIEDLARDLSDGVIIARYVEYLLDVVREGAVEMPMRAHIASEKRRSALQSIVDCRKGGELACSVQGAG